MSINMVFFRKKRSFAIWGVFLLALFFYSPTVKGAQIFFGAQSQRVGVNKNFAVGVFINTQGEQINAIQGKIVFDPIQIELQNIIDGNSLINFWIERPLPTPLVKKEGEIFFSGIVPGGYGGENGLLFSLVFQTKVKGTAVITSKDEQVLLHDGKGTPTSVSKAPLKLSIVAKTNVPEFLYPYDADPPESFTPVVSRDPTVFAGKYFLVFATQDKGSGIDHYEIQESTSKLPDLGKWSRRQSPYMLTDQTLRSYIYVKAVDKAGNERVAIILPRVPLQNYQIYILWSILIIGIVLISLRLKAMGKIFFQTWRKD